MTKTLSELIDNANSIAVALKLSSYQLFQFEDGSFVDLKTTIVHDPALILRLAGGLKVKFLPDEPFVIIRLYEREDETDT